MFTKVQTIRLNADEHEDSADVFFDFNRLCRSRATLDFLSELLQRWRASFQRNSMHGICLTKVLGNGVLFVNRNFMRETTFTGKRNFNIKRSYHRVVHERFGIDKQIVEQAQVALAENLERERALGLWISRNQPRINAG